MSISDDTLRLVMAIFFGGLGLIHFVFFKTMVKYSVEADLLNSETAVRMSGVLLIACSIMLYIPKYVDYAFYGLSGFLIISAIILHKFWSKNTALEQLKELLHFLKNIFLAVLVWYVKEALE